MAPYGPDHALAVRARALDNRRNHVYLNQVGRVGDLDLVGGSCLAAPDGALIASARSDEQVLAVDVAGAASSADVDYLGHVRADLPVFRPGHSYDQN